MYIHTNGVDYSGSVTSTVFAAAPLVSTDGNKVGEIENNQLKLKKGTFDFIVPIGSNGNTVWTELGIHDGSNYIFTCDNTSYNGGVSIVSLTDIKFTLTFKEDTVLEFRVKSDQAGWGIYVGKITVEEREG